jgi:regulator of sigma D
VIQAGGTITKTVCTLPNKAREVLFPLLNVVATMEYRRVKVPNKVTGKVELQTKRVISFEGSEYIEAKDRDACLPKELTLAKDPKKNFETFKSFYANKR